VGGNFKQNVVAGPYYENANVNLISAEMKADIAELRAVSINIFCIDLPIFMHVSECGFQESSQSWKC
jgi:hypothetical protein